MKCNVWLMKKLIPVFLLLYVLLFGCSISHEDQKTSEGTIFYKIAYSHPQTLDVPQELLPGIMVMKFNNRYTNSTIEGFMGLFSISIVSDLKETRSTTMLKIFDKKYYYQGAVGATPGYPENPGTIKITPLDEEKIIAGVKCKKALIEYTDQEIKPFNVYYTTEIGPKHPNINNPYHELPGVLMEFDLSIGDLSMRMIADRINMNAGSKNDFSIPENYKPISENKMKELIDTLLD